MAKVEFDGMERYERMLTDFARDIVAVEKMAVYDGAKVMADEIHDAIETHPTHGNAVEGMTKLEQRALLKGLGISAMKQDDDSINVKIGFDGYDDFRKTSTWTKGVPIPLTARSLMKGTSWRKKDDFMTKAISRARDKVNKAMEQKLDEEVEKRTK